MTLGSKFFCCSKMVVTRRRKLQNKQFVAGSPPLDVSYRSSLSKRDLKPSKVFFKNLHATLDSQLMKYFAQKAPAGRLSGYTHTHTYKHITWHRESNLSNKSKYNINKQICVQNAFSTFPTNWNESFDWILSGFYPLRTIECIIWRLKPHATDPPNLFFNVSFGFSISIVPPSK